MERIMKTQTMGDSRAMEYMKGKKIMEINPEHPMVKGLNEEVRTNKISQKAKMLTEVLYETALLTSGFVLESPSDYADKVYQMLSKTVESSTANGTPSEAKTDETKAETVTPEVVRDSDEPDPWKV